MAYIDPGAYQYMTSAQKAAANTGTSTPVAQTPVAAPVYSPTSSSAFLTPDQYAGVQQAQQTVQAAKPVTTLSSASGKTTTQKNIGTLTGIESSYMGPSIVDYLGSTGQDSSYGARSKMAGDAGISNYTGTPDQNTQLLNLLRAPAGNPALGGMVNDINKAIQGGGLTLEEQQGYSDLIKAQDGVVSAAASARQALEEGDYTSLDKYTRFINDQQKLLTDHVSAYYEKIAPLRQKLAQNLTPGAREQQVARELTGIRGEIDQRALQLQKDQLSEFEGQSLNFSRGRASELDFKESFAKQELLLKEKNLLSELGLLTELRKMEGQSIEQQMQFISEDLELQTKVNEKLAQMEEDIFKRAETIQGDAKEQLGSFLDLLDGVDPATVGQDVRKQLEDLAARSGIPSDLLFQALDVQYKRSLVEQATKTKKETEESTVPTINPRTQQVLDGFITIDQLTTTEQQKVRDQLFEQGFGSDEPPQWFIDFIQESRQQSMLPVAVQDEWIKYRDSVIDGQTASTSGGQEGLGFDDF